ncbi:uncharacterized protein LOC125573692 [Nematostella vectensis]|uniref:uncharacterized protein LOC125573692 n=1 Tax=Nematostella vectensis TaxID=45351 RepID=UPI0020773912|nr:uncharacterized protein LOC125573692 [Nematostella vectensis]
MPSSALGKTPSSTSKNSTRIITLGWLNYAEGSKGYKAVRAPRGGGTRSISVSKQATGRKILQEALKLFISGQEDNFEIYLGNFKGEAFQNKSFTVEEYYVIHGLTRARFYLMTKEKKKGGTGSSPVETVVVDDDANESAGKEGLKDNLLGTSAECSQLKREQDDAFLKRQEADQKKDAEKRKKEEELENLKWQRAARATRVTNEPPATDDAILVSCRHVSGL